MNQSLIYLTFFYPILLFWNRINTAIRYYKELV